MALTDKLKAIGDAIRAKTGKSGKLTLDEMASEVEALPDTSEMFTKDEIKGYFENEPKALNKLARAINQTTTSLGGYSFYEKPLITNREKVTEDEMGKALDWPMLESVGNNCFYNCNNVNYDTGSLVRFKFNAPRLVSAGGYAFGFTQFRYAYLPKLKKLGTNCFISSQLKELTLPSVEELKENELELPYATVISLPALKTISAPYYFYAPFKDTYKLEALILADSSVVSLADSEGLIGELTDTRSTLSPAYSGKVKGYIYVPKALIEDYKVATNWSVFADKFRAIEDYPDICKPYEEATE